MPDASRLTLELSDQLTSVLAQVAASTGRPLEVVALEAIADFAQRELEFIQAVEEAREDFRRGRFYSTAEVMAHAREVIDKHRSAREL